MNYNDMVDTMDKLLEHPKGFLCYKDFEFNLDNLENISGVISSSPTKYVNGLQIDEGTINFNDNPITIGNDNLINNLTLLQNNNYKFALWHTKFNINLSIGNPTKICIHRNISNIINFVLLSQSNSIIPLIYLNFVIEDHEYVDGSEYIIKEILSKMFREFIKSNVILDLLLIVIKPIIQSNDIEDISFRTLKILQEVIPVSVPGILFSSEDTDKELFNNIYKKICDVRTNKPWRLSFILNNYSNEEIIKFENNIKNI
jgi:fructose-bisphosphate aldolase class 1